MWTIERNGRTFGPYDAAHLRRFAQQGIIAPETALISAEGRRTSASRVAGLQFGPFLDVDPPPPLPPRTETPAAATVESKGAAPPSPSPGPLYSRAQWIAVAVGMLLFHNRGCHLNRDAASRDAPKPNFHSPPTAR